MSVSILLARLEHDNPNMARAISKKRKIYGLLMNLPRNTMREIQFRAVLANYIEGTGKCYDRDIERFTNKIKIKLK